MLHSTRAPRTSPSLLTLAALLAFATAAVTARPEALARQAAAAGRTPATRAKAFTTLDQVLAAPFASELVASPDHGDDDRNVPFSETVDVAAALRRQGVDVELLVLPDEVHGFLLQSSWRRTFERASSFFDSRMPRR